MSRALAALVVLMFVVPALAQPTATGRVIAMSDPAWTLFVPSDYVYRGGVADLLVHFHGDSQTYWNNAKYAKLDAIIVTVNYGGLSSAYQTPFQNNTALFNTLMSDALTRVRNLSDFPDNLAWDRLAVSSFSAGYGAVREILKQPSYFDRINMIASCDTIYAGFVNYPTNLQLIDSQMVDWRRYADEAAAGNKTFIVSHSQVDPVTYASTVLTANDLMSHIAVSPQAYTATGLGTLDFYRRASLGKFKMYGANGADGDSHLEHLRYCGQFLQELPLAQVPEPCSVAWLVGAVACINTRAARSFRNGRS